MCNITSQALTWLCGGTQKVTAPHISPAIPRPSPYVGGGSGYKRLVHYSTLLVLSVRALFVLDTTGIRVGSQMGRVKRIWYLSPMRAMKVQASLHIRAVLPEPPLLAHTSSESRGTLRQKASSLAPLNDWACAVKICHDGRMLEDTNSLDAPQIAIQGSFSYITYGKFFFSSNTLAVRTPKIILKLLLKTFSFSSNSDYFHAFEFLILRTLKNARNNA